MKCVQCEKELESDWCYFCAQYSSDDINETKELHPNWEFLGCGRHRHAWRLPSGNVIKIPKGGGGEYANEREARAWSLRHNREAVEPLMRTFEFARCRLIPDTSILVMEYVDPYENSSIDYAALPLWAKQVDCQQVGHNRQGRLVAYDFAE